jgi:methylmalonyl-CoA mutase N-terminal domain/subunit
LTPEEQARFDQARREWEERTLKPSLARARERPGPFADSAGAPVDRLHTPADTAGLDYVRDLGFPGELPFTRGVQPTMYRGRLWTMRQYAGFGSAAETNRRFRYLLEQGQSGLSVAFDLPTQMGYDADHEMARSEVGKVGVAISSLEDMAALFEAIPLDRVSTSMTINSTASILLCLYMAVGERQGVPSERLSGTVQNDILKEYIARGTYVFPPGPSMRLITDTFAFCRERVPRWNTISISGYHLREAGSTAAQEVAFTLANGIAYVTAAQEAGLAVDEFAPQLSFFFNAHNNLLEEVAKFRAARRLWARIMRERFAARDPRSQMLRFHAQTAGSMLTAQQPENNIVRVGVADIVDPLGGSYTIERTTRRIEEEAETYIAKIDGLGGSVNAIAFMQREIQEAAYRYQQEVEAGQRVVVGVNEFVMDEPSPANLFQVDAGVGQALAERLAALRRARDDAAAARALDAVDRAARGRDNLLPHILTAVRAQVTLGEICDTLRRVFGVHQPSVVF